MIRTLCMLFCLAACEQEATTALPDLGPHSCSGAISPAEIACCPSDLPQHGACEAGDRCLSFELACDCKSGQWCCQIGALPIYGCERLQECYAECALLSDPSCDDDCAELANQHTLDLQSALEACVRDQCAASDGGSANCLTGPCQDVWNDCLADQPTCRF